jgi:Exostosin family
LKRDSSRHVTGDAGIQGKKFRSDFAEAMLKLNMTDSIVQCNEGRLGHAGYNKMSHEQMMRYLTQSVFCPVLPGDDQSSQHLTERYLTGCIPVFVGPPFHAMPFSQEISYAASAVFINVTLSRSWLKDIQMMWSYPSIPEVRVVCHLHVVCKWAAHCVRVSLCKRRRL